MQVEAFIRGELQAGRPIYGFGHAVLREEDPQARLQFQIGSELCPDDPNFRIVTTLREVAPRVLSEIEKISNPHANVDIASGTLLHYAGFHDASTYTLFFGWASASLASVLNSWMRQRCSGREGRCHLSTEVHR